MSKSCMGRQITRTPLTPAHDCGMLPEAFHRGLRKERGMMLTLTDKATEKMKEALQQEGKPGYGLRLVAQAGSCSCCGPAYGLFPEKETHSEDTVLSQGDVRIFIDPSSMALLEGATIDFIDHPEQGQGFTIKNPNREAQEKGECGCGSAEASSEGSCGCGGNCGCSHS